METYETQIMAYTAKIVNLTGEIEKMEKDPEAFNEAYTESIKVQIKQVEALVVELQSSVHGSFAVFEYIRETVTSMTSTQTRLEAKYDKNRVLQTRRDYIKIQLQLEECERRYQQIFNPNIGSSCAHTGIIRVSQPIVSQINADLSARYTFGAWGKDSKPLHGRESMYWYSGYTSAAITDVRFYNNYKDLILRNYFQHHTLQSGWTGTGNNVLIRENVLYYQRNSPFSMAKVNFTSMNYEYRIVSKASTRFSYAHSPNQNFDFAADETGLWVTYASEESSGQLILAKINEPSFGIEEEWQTSVYKPGLSNAFMVCGVLYAVRTVDIQTEKIFYMFDTKTQQEHYINVPFERFQETYINLDYNPTDQKLYMYNNGYYVNYQLSFNYTTKAIEDKPPLLMKLTQ
ncbi:Olfactomedin-4 [Merluccius polli]|uniref:Olfactomedin-4 n=1 Tax=Merluccius polli TaxID=89951 RepID=A0AA47P8P3_MERPO|nr:Olfactomedin-4 [Merluccius polli]